MMIQLLKSYTVRGKKVPPGKVFRRRDREAERMIEERIAIQYNGPYPPKKMKINLKDL